ncbi:hypothetical protein PAXRUDRAFT_416898 [Paxillus rubicundulus Ve08.2h10]|uniref:Unplaced genomic scaffold scaffold_2517, whole genome shotgun sequence n=1 Tax=Paxillus rubicundulus Ve08.2h10 TaxID=930991 RepID=A0A0D0CZI2_9AGAM|nr:hypothetical protein PAXRUDRAFT_416898 [Paxillus rubicundulus Ve08.2h10]
MMHHRCPTIVVIDIKKTRCGRILIAQFEYPTSDYQCISTFDEDRKRLVELIRVLHFSHSFLE